MSCRQLAWLAGLVGAIAVVVAHAQPEMKSLTFGTTSDVQIGGPWFVARDKGFLAQEGFEKFEVTTFSTAPQMFPAFVSGSLPVISFADQPMLALAAGDVPVKLVAVYSDLTGLHGMLATAEVRTAKDLEGKKVGVQKGTVMEWFTRNFCRTYGCDIGKVAIINMSPPEGAAALLAGSVDAVASWQPFLGQTLQAGKARGFHFLHYNNTSHMPGTEGQRRKIHSSLSVLLMSPAFIEKNPRTIDGLLRALDKSVAFIRSNPDDAAKLIGAQLKLPEAIARSQLGDVRYELVVNNDRINELQATADLLAREKLIKRNVNVGGSLLDPAPLRRLRADAIPYGK